MQKYTQLTSNSLNSSNNTQKSNKAFSEIQDDILIVSSCKFFGLTYI